MKNCLLRINFLICYIKVDANSMKNQAVETQLKKLIRIEKGVENYITLKVSSNRSSEWPDKGDNDKTMVPESVKSSRFRKLVFGILYLSVQFGQIKTKILLPQF